jgi:creatinine amidohydrolase
VEALKANYIELRRAAREGVAVIPMGSLEAHGPHLPCGTDSLILDGIVARAVAASDPRRVVVFPMVRYSIVEWARPFASVGVSPATLLSKLVDLTRDVHALGFRKILFVQGHGNMPAVQMAIWQLRREGTRALYVDANPYLMAADRAAEIAGEPVTHAGTIETSLMLALHPDLVRMDAAVDGPGDLWGREFPFPAIRNRPGVFCTPSVADLPEAVEGSATRATAELGGRLLEVYAAAVAEALGDLVGKEVPRSFVEPFRKEIDG